MPLRRKRMKLTQLKTDARYAKSLNVFKKLIISKKKEKSLFSVYNPLGITA